MSADRRSGQPGRLTRQQRRKAEREAAKREVSLTLGGQIVNHACEFNVAVWNPVELRQHPAGDKANGPPPRIVRAVIDTGCTRTTIRPDIAAALSLPVHDKAQAYVANSKQPQATYTVHAVLGLPRTGEDYLIRPFSLMVSDGHDEMLFGMDALAGGVLTVDVDAGIWRWEVFRDPMAPRTG